MPPSFFSGFASGRNTSCPGVSAASRIRRKGCGRKLWAILQHSRFLQALAEQAHAAAHGHVRRREAAAGFEVGEYGRLREMVSNSSIVSGTPASRAIASRCSTALVEPPVAKTEAMAIAQRRMRDDRPRRISFSRSCITSLPQSIATCALPGSTAGTSFAPIGEMPRKVIAVAMVLAVNWPPQAPRRGRRVSRTAALLLGIFPAAKRRGFENILNGHIVPMEISGQMAAVKRDQAVRRARAIAVPGMVLSQPQMATTASRLRAHEESMESAITSRDTSEPSCPRFPS